jgi:outer membrane receptor protein involved in Fe transport
MTIRRTALLCGTTLGLMLSLTAISAQAQVGTAAGPNTPTTSDDSDNSTEVGEVVVVGSRIRRDAYNTPSPVQLITREETTLAGFNSPMEVLQSNAVTGGQAQIDNTFGGFVTQGGPGANTIGLRGLSAQRTLVLLNGRRIAPVGTRGAVGSADLNVLPDALIDHIEILKDGASSIYGSDAIAGVINIITKKNVDGLTLETQYNGPMHHGGETFRASVSAGLNRGPLQLAGSFEYYNRSDLTLGDRKWARCNTDYLFNDPSVDLSRFDVDPATGLPKCYPITFGPTFGSNGVTINTIGTPRVPGMAAAGVFPDTDANGDPVVGFVRWRPNSAVTTGIPGFEAVGSDNLYARDTFDPAMLKQSLISPAENYVGYLQGTLDMNDGSQFYGEVLLSKRYSSQVSYRQLSLDYPFLTTPGTVNTNPLLPTSLQFDQPFSIRQDPDITSGLPIGIRAFIGYGNDYSTQRVFAGKATIGWRGDLKFKPDWRFDINAQYQDSDADYTFESFIQSHLTQSLALAPTGSTAFPSVVGTDGLTYTCASNVSGATSNCVPAPVLTTQVIEGKLPQNFKNWIFKPVTGNTKYAEATIAANFDGPIMKLPAGDLKGALGIEWRHDQLKDEPPPESVANDLFNLTSAVPSRGTDSVWELYAEAEAPILHDAPFAKDLTLNVSGRYTKYRDFDSETTYKFGASYQPFQFLTFRGTIGTSYRAPAVFESHQGATSGFQAGTSDICNNYGAKPATSLLFINCDADLHNPAFVDNNGIVVQTVGGRDLVPETSKNYTFGFILQPELGDRWGQVQLAVDYYNITVDDEISQYLFTTIMANCYNDPQFRSHSGFCDFIHRNAAGQLTIDNGYVNISKQVVRGIDYNARYTHPIGDGSLRLNLLITRYLEQSTRQTPGGDLIDYNGTILQPKYTGQFDATYSWKNWKFRYGLDWIDKMNSYELEFGTPAANFTNTGFQFKTPNYYLSNVSVEYIGQQNWSAIVGVRNLADRDPPIISAGGYALIGNAPLYSSYDYLGRTVFVNVSKKF